MEDLPNMKNFSTGPSCSISLLAVLHATDEYTDTKLCSDGHVVSVHSALLAQCSEVMRDVLDSQEQI